MRKRVFSGAGSVAVSRNGRRVGQRWKRTKVFRCGQNLKLRNGLLADICPAHSK